MERNDLTPMLRQYLALKQELPENCILLLRLGDFYEVFMDDAKRAAPILGLTLTHRAGQPMCGFPVATVDAYLFKLVRAGLKAAIADQMEAPLRRDGLVRREVTRVVKGEAEPEAAPAQEREPSNIGAPDPCEGYDSGRESCFFRLTLDGLAISVDTPGGCGFFEVPRDRRNDLAAILRGDSGLWSTNVPPFQRRFRHEYTACGARYRLDVSSIADAPVLDDPGVVLDLGVTRRGNPPERSVLRIPRADAARIAGLVAVA